MRRLPILSTALVLAAVALMIALGVWQLHRATWKEHLIARYDRALASGTEVPFPYAADAQEGALYHRSSLDCTRVIDRGAIAGRNDRDETGWAQTALCGTPDGEAEIALGWSRDPATPAWSGGPVTGWVAPRADGVRLVAAPPVAGLVPLAKPDPHTIPNNHLSYAVQWFFFAATALVIYLLALRKKLREG
ncbi:MAG: SURF1 family protein [Novosphingobium sp.]|nr:SURF1 family protein [Novosphingobium sp.]